MIYRIKRNNISYMDVQYISNEFTMLPHVIKNQKRNIKDEMGNEWVKGKHISWLYELEFYFLCFKFNIVVRK